MASSNNSFSFNLNVTPQSPDDHPQSKTQSFASVGAVMEVINQMYSDNKKMTTMVSQIFHDYTSLHSQLMQYFTSNNHHQNCSLTDNHENRKRNADHLDNSIHDEDDDTMNNITTNCLFSDVGNCCKRMKTMTVKPNVSTRYVRVDSSDSSLVVKDGYQWRKYGQKVTRDNPSPRAYFKCSFAPLCPVKKKVQKSVEDPSLLVVTYEGEHTHKKPSTQPTILTPSTIIPPSSPVHFSPSSVYSSASAHLIQNLLVNDHTNENSEEENVGDRDRSPVQHWLVEQMASSLTKDPTFASALANAISDKILDQTFC